MQSSLGVNLDVNLPSLFPVALMGYQTVTFAKQPTSQEVLVLGFMELSLRRIPAVLPAERGHPAAVLGIRLPLYRVLGEVMMTLSSWVKSIQGKIEIKKQKRLGSLGGSVG